MWPVMTLTFLLQLTDEEQLFAQAPLPAVQPAEEQQPATPVVMEETCAAWPEKPVTEEG